MYTVLPCGGLLGVILASTLLCDAAVPAVVAPTLAPAMDLDLSLLGSALVLLVPAGLTMMAVGCWGEQKAPTVAATGLIAVALGVVVYALIGFAFQFGGLGLIADLKGGEGLVSEWSPVDRLWGPGWGIIGLNGFVMLRRTLDGELLSVLLYQAALAATAASIPILALSGRLRFLPLLGLGVLHAGLTYPIYGNWVWGGGWLSQLGRNVGLGHGFIDLAGSGTVFAAGGLIALAAILAFGARLEKRAEVSEPPPLHFPLLALLGAFLVLLGWFGLTLSNPLVTSGVSPARTAVNVMVAASGGILVSSLYTWFATGRADLLMMTRGMLGALVAISASCAFIPPWAAMVIGALAGLMVPLTLYLVEARLRLEDPTAVIAVHVVSGLWGLLALGIFADGASGQGWNGVGAGKYLTVARQGVSGLFVTSGFQPDWPHQFYAQIAGAVALVALSFGLAWLVFRGLDGLASRLAGLRCKMRQAHDDSGTPQ